MTGKSSLNNGNPGVGDGKGRVESLISPENLGHQECLGLTASVIKLRAWMGQVRPGSEGADIEVDVQVTVLQDKPSPEGPVELHSAVREGSNLSLSSEIPRTSQSQTNTQGLFLQYLHFTPSPFSSDLLQTNWNSFSPISGMLRSLCLSLSPSVKLRRRKSFSMSTTEASLIFQCLPTPVWSPQ